jgi:RNA polymerase sigma-54 factor
LQNKQYRDLARAVNRPLPVVMTAIDVIRGLDPRPGLRYNRAQARLVEPEVFFVKVGDEYKVLLNEDELPQLRLSSVYRRLLDRRTAPREVRSYIRDRFSAAIQLMKNIAQRKHTIQRVGEIIVQRQRDFLDRGPDHLKPLMIKEVAEEVGVHPSTVSRAVANKYAHTPQGVLELRSFFSESVGGPLGQDTSLVTLKRRVRKMIEEEDAAHPLTDERIAQRLAAEGIKVTRRTVAKYREDMKIPSTHQRRVKN